MRFGKITVDNPTLDDTQVDRKKVFSYLFKTKKKKHLNRAEVSFFFNK